MDMKNLVEKITKDVMESLKEKQAAPAVVKELPRPAGKKVYLLADAGYSTEDWKKLLGGFQDVSVVTCERATVPDDPSLKASIREVIPFREGAAFLAEAGSVIYRATRPYQLAQIVQLMDNNPVVMTILDALSRGINVTVLDSVERAGRAWETRLDSLVKELCAMGISVEKSKRVAAHSRCEVEKGECAGCGQCAALIPGKVSVVVEAGAERISSSLGAKGINREVAAMIDHTLLKPDATKEQVMELCAEAREYVFASVCINPAFVKLASECLRGSPVKVCTVIGFPLGATTSVTKAIETRDAIANGADEIDMVINVGALKAGNYELVQKDIEAVVEAACGKLVKVILETALLTDEEKVMACKISSRAGADFVKTSTGFGPGGATAQDIALMRQTVGKYMGVKASGGIRDFETARKMIEAGATRIGASASVAIVKGEKGEGKY